MTRPGVGERRRVVVREAAAELAARRPSTAPRRPRDRRAARRRTGSAAGRPRPPGASLRPIRSSVSPWSRRRSEWPTITQSASPASIGARDVAGVRAGQLVVDVLGADADVRSPRERVADGGEADERRADDPGRRPRLAVRAAIVAASSPASAGRRVHLPVGGDDDGAHRPNHARARLAPGRAGRPVARAGRPIALVRVAAASRSIRSSARWTAERWSLEPLGELAERRLGRLAAGVGDRAGRRTAARPARPSRLELLDRRDLAAGRPDGPLEVRRLGVEDPVQVAAERPRHLARLELEERRRPPRSGAGTARRCRRSSRSRRRGRGGSATTPAARRSSSRRGEDAAPRPASTTNSRWVRPPARLSEPRARNRPRSQAIRQCSADGVPVERTRRRRAPVAGGRRDRAAAPSRTSQPRDRRVGRPSRPRPASREPGRLGPPVARPRRVDRGELRAEGEDQVAVRSPLTRAAVAGVRRGRSSHGRQAVRAAARAGGRCPRARRIRHDAAASRPGSWWWAVAGSTTSSRTSAAAPARRRRPASAGPARHGSSAARAPPNRLLARTTSTMPGAGVGDERLDVVGEVEAGRLAVLGRDVADVDAERRRRRDRVADLGQEEARQEARVEAARARGRSGRPRRSRRARPREARHVGRA